MFRRHFAVFRLRNRTPNHVSERNSHQVGKANLPCRLDQKSKGHLYGVLCFFVEDSKGLRRHFAVFRLRNRTPNHVSERNSHQVGKANLPCRLDHIGMQVLIQHLRSFSFFKKWLNTRLFGTFANKINFIVLKLNTQKSQLSDSNPPCFDSLKSR